MSSVQRNLCKFVETAVGKRLIVYSNCKRLDTYIFRCPCRNICVFFSNERWLLIPRRVRKAKIHTEKLPNFVYPFVMIYRPDGSLREILQDQTTCDEGNLGKQLTGGKAGREGCCGSRWVKGRGNNARSSKWRVNCSQESPNLTLERGRNFSPIKRIKFFRLCY